MLISVEHRFIFVHVFKTGGSSVRAALAPYSSRDIPYHFLRRSITRRLWQGVCRNARQDHVVTGEAFHVSARQIANLVSERFWSKTYKFAFVRNTWDWVVSQFFYMAQNREAFTHSHPSFVHHLDNFEDFVDHLCDQPPLCQIDFLVGPDGQMLVDFVGHYENLQHDFGTVCEAICISATLPHLNQSCHAEYRHYYSDQLVRKIAARYKKDIDLFLFEF